MDLSPDEQAYLDAVLKRMNKPLPRFVTPETHYSLPIMMTGQAHWHIVEADEKGDPVKPKRIVFTYMFPQPDPNHPAFKQVKNAANAYAERLAEVFNAGQEALNQNNNDDGGNDIIPDIED